MNFVAHPARRVARALLNVCQTTRAICDFGFYGDGGGDEYLPVEGLIEEYADEHFLSVSDGPEDADECQFDGASSSRRLFRARSWTDADRIFDILKQDGLGFNVKSALDELNIKVSGLLVREVLLKILRNANNANKTWPAKMGSKFFYWCEQQGDYKHTVNSYHLMMKIYADAGEYSTMWKLVVDMTERGFPISARTFNILICTLCEAGMSRKVVEKSFKYAKLNWRPFKHSYNAILHSLLSVKQFKLIEWVYQLMLDDGHAPDILTYNILMYAKYRLGKMDHFHRLIDEMGKDGLSPDIHTYNTLLHVLGRGNKPLAALNLLDHMKEVGASPSILHYTTLMDGLSRAGNMEACQYFFDHMVKDEIKPDVVCYTVLLTGYALTGVLDRAQQLFDEMTSLGHLPNAFTYNAMIRGLCMAGKFDEACCMIKEMEYRGCNPNFLVYSTLVGSLRNAGKLSEAHEVIRNMSEKGHYVHLIPLLTKHRRR